MKLDRRSFLGAAAGAGALAATTAPTANAAEVTDETLEAAAAKPVLDRAPFKDPVVIESIDLLRKGREHFLRVRSKDGAVGVSLDNGRADLLHPIINRLVAPYFVGKDARDLEALLFGVYRERDNYK
jgi:hypothetical protein